MKLTILPVAILVLGFMSPLAIAQEEDPPWEWSEERIEQAVNNMPRHGVTSTAYRIDDQGVR